MLMLSKYASIEFQKNNETPKEYAHIPEQLSDEFVFDVAPDMEMLSLEETILTNGISIIGKPFKADGAYRIDLNTGAMKAYISDWLTGKETEWITMDGMILRGDDNRLYQPVDLFPLTEKEKKAGKLSIYDGFPYPTDNCPSLSDLVVRRVDVEEFEHRFTENDIEKSGVHIDLEERILKTNTLVLLFESIKKAVNDYPRWRDEFKRDTIQMSDIDEWLNESVTSTKREAEIVKKILVEIFSLKKTIS
jgi:hypothetical protein